MTHHNHLLRLIHHLLTCCSPTRRFTPTSAPFFWRGGSSQHTGDHRYDIGVIGKDGLRTISPSNQPTLFHYSYALREREKVALVLNGWALQSGRSRGDDMAATITPDTWSSDAHVLSPHAPSHHAHDLPCQCFPTFPH